MKTQDILVRIENTNSKDDSYDDLRCRLKDCADEINSLRVALEQMATREEISTDRINELKSEIRELQELKD